jgi:hypothetical protein
MFEADRKKQAYHNSQLVQSAAGSDCGCGPQERYSLNGCGPESPLPVIVDGAQFVEDGSVERGQIRVPSPEQYASSSDRLCPNFTTLDNGELQISTTGYSNNQFDPTKEGNPGLYRITLTANSADEARAFRGRVDLLFKQYTQLGSPGTANSGIGREGIISFEVQASASDTLIDIWALPSVEIGGNRGHIIEPALLGGINLNGLFVDLTGNEDFAPAYINSSVALGSEDVDGEGEEIVDPNTKVVFQKGGTSAPIALGETGNPMTDKYTLSVRAYGPMSSQYHSITTKLLQVAGA